MNPYSLSHLADETVLSGLALRVRQDRANTAELLAYVAEVQARKLHVPAGYSSMFEYCVHELHLSEDAAWRRIRAAQTARRFPAIFAALAEGRLHLTAVLQLRDFLTTQNARELLTAAELKTKSEIELLLAHRFPKADVPTRIQPIPSPSRVAPSPLEGPSVGVALAPVAGSETPVALAPVEGSETPVAPAPVAGSETPVAPAPVIASVSPAKVTPPSPQRFGLQVTIRQETHDLLRYAQDLLGHQVAPGDVEEVILRALRQYVRSLEKKKFAATDRPRAQRSPARGRNVPDAIKRAVWERDGGQCTFVSKAGHRCETRRDLEYDHIDEVARGGTATIDRIRLRWWDPLESTCRHASLSIL